MILSGTSHINSIVKEKKLWVYVFIRPSFTTAIKILCAVVISEILQLFLAENCYVLLSYSQELANGRILYKITSSNELPSGEA